MTIYEYLMKAVQDDARRAGERDRLLLEARRARRAHRQRLVPATPARRRTEMGKIVVSENVTLDGVIQDPAGDEGFRAGGWVGLIGNSPQLAKLALDEALAAGAFLLGLENDPLVLAQQVVGGDHGAAADRQRRGEGPVGRQRLAGRQFALVDQPA